MFDVRLRGGLEAESFYLRIKHIYRVRNLYRFFAGKKNAKKMTEVPHSINADQMGGMDAANHGPPLCDPGKKSHSHSHSHSRS